MALNSILRHLMEPNGIFEGKLILQHVFAKLHEITIKIDGIMPKILIEAAII